MIYIIVWLFICVVIVSYSATDCVTKGKKNKKWHIISFLTAWLIGILSPFIFLADIFKKLFRKQELK